MSLLHAHDLVRSIAYGRPIQRTLTSASLGSNQGQTSTSTGTEPTSLVKINFRGKTVTCTNGKLLRTALLKAELSPHNGNSKYINCRGLGTCGTCAVQVKKGTVEPEEWTVKEKFRLNFPPHRPPANGKLRLACQCKVMSDLDVVKFDKFWGEGENESEEAASAFVLPLGNLEYVLDNGKDKKTEQ